MKTKITFILGALLISTAIFLQYYIQNDAFDFFKGITFGCGIGLLLTGPLLKIKHAKTNLNLYNILKREATASLFLYG